MTEDFGVAHRTDDEIEGAYRSLCSSILMAAVQGVERGTKLGAFSGRLKQYREYSYRKTQTWQAGLARRWLEEPETGIVTFSECCDALGMEAEVMREKVMDWCRARKRREPYVPRYGSLP